MQAGRKSILHVGPITPGALVPSRVEAAKQIPKQLPFGASTGAFDLFASLDFILPRLEAAANSEKIYLLLIDFSKLKLYNDGGSWKWC